MAERGVNAPFERYRTRPDQATGQEGWDQTDGAEYGDLDARIQRPDDDDGEPASTHAPPSEPEPDDRYARMDRG
jgi:hypothetical protein